MKKIIFSVLAISTIVFSACNNSGKNEHEGHDMNNMNKTVLNMPLQQMIKM